MLEQMLNAYYDKFGENYPLMITEVVDADEVIEDIVRCIENNEPATPMELEPGLDY